MPLDPGIDWRHAARLLRGKSPADLRQLIGDAAGRALTADRDEVTERDIVDAIRRDGRIEPEDTLDLAALHRVAIHEAGHVAVCVALRGAGWVYAVRLGPLGGATAYGDETVPLTGRPDDETRDSLAVSFGGIAAEMAVLSEGTLGGSSDVSSATQTALGRISAGLTDDPAPLDLDWLGTNVADSLKEALAGALVARSPGPRGRARRSCTGRPARRAS
jgi:ATP-dependent Zn protease